MISGTVKRQNPEAQPVQVNKSYYPNYDYREYVSKKSRTNSFLIFTTFALLGISIVVLWDKMESFMQKVLVRWFDPDTTENEITLKD